MSAGNKLKEWERSKVRCPESEYGQVEPGRMLALVLETQRGGLKIRGNALVLTSRPKDCGPPMIIIVAFLLPFRVVLRVFG